MVLGKSFLAYLAGNILVSCLNIGGAVGNTEMISAGETEVNER